MIATVSMEDNSIMNLSHVFESKAEKLLKNVNFYV